MDRRPDFVIIGAMKCATSTLHEQLAAQSGMFMSTPKEPNFFSDDAQFERGMEWYFGLFQGARATDLCGESSTHYTKIPTHPRTVERLAQHVPDAKFIYLMRHPVDRLISHYVHEWTQRVIDVPLAEALDRHPALVDYGCYAEQLRPYLDRFGADRVLPVFFDRMRTHPQAELERVCRFLGYAREPRWRADLQPQNVSSERMRPSRWRDMVVHAPILSTLRRRLVPQRVRDRIKQLWTIRDRPTLSEADRQRLSRRFDADLADLGRWLGIELSCSNFVEVTSAQAYPWVDVPRQTATFGMN